MLRSEYDDVSDVFVFLWNCKGTGKIIQIEDETQGAYSEMDTEAQHREAKS